jgi:geranylgeranyl pyrophosphate synthase
MKISDLFDLSQTRLEKIFAHYLKTMRTCSPLLQEAMAYGVFNGGKRIRPALIYAASCVFDAPLENCDIGACAVEFIHSYSLIHDDLPAMDNADLRRGQPSCHKKFDDAIAILAGDTLQPLAFELIATHPAPLSTDQRLSMIKTLAFASGFNGMAAGQVLDIKGIQSQTELINMYQLKTGALLTASLQMGAIAADIQDEKILRALKNFTDAIGLAFQIQDDLLDMESNELTGKPQGIDRANNKSTYPALFGVAQSQEKIETLFVQGLDAITFLGEKANTLRELANYILQRKN